QSFYCVFSLMTLHPLVFFILIWEPGHLSKDIRIGYIANQKSHVLLEWGYNVLLRVYPLMPYTALHCGGFLCGIGIPPQILLTILATVVVLPNLPFIYLLLVMHQTLVLNVHSIFRQSKKTRRAFIALLISLLVMHIAGFAIYGRQTAKEDELLRRPELAWLADKGGEVFLFGDVGSPESFAYECYILGAAFAISSPFVIFFSAHSIRIISYTNQGLSDTTYRLQLRATKVLLLQMPWVLFFYAIPLGLLIMSILFGSMHMPQEVIAFGRLLYSFTKMTIAAR
ncbi:hypothetical protein PENTCL1PPCAC_14527, partial [Pristionchus entomophagus]